MTKIDIEFKKEFEEVYKRKKENTLDSIELINNFCGKWADRPKVEYIPLVLKLYYHDVDTPAQNEFVDCLLDAIIEKYPRKAMQTIMQNLNVLEEEGEEENIRNIFSSMWYKNDRIFAQVLSEYGEWSERAIRELVKNANEVTEEKYNFIPTTAKVILDLYYENKYNL